ncbi:hypothetical protein [Streptomyces lydicus]
MKSWKIRTTTSASCGTSFVDEVHATAGGAGDRALDVFDDVDEVFEIPGLADEAVEVVEDHAVDDSVGEVGQELAELGAQDDPVDGAVGLDDLALFEGLDE